MALTWTVVIALKSAVINVWSWRVVNAATCAGDIPVTIGVTANPLNFVKLSKFAFYHSNLVPKRVSNKLIEMLEIELSSVPYVLWRD